MEMPMLTRIREKLAQLQVPVQVRMTSDMCDEQADDVCLVTAGPFTLFCDAALPGADTMLRLAAALAGEMTGSAPCDPETYYLSCFRDGADCDEQLAEACGCPLTLPRCVMLLQDARDGAAHLLQTLNSVIPLEGHDTLAELNRRQVLLIKDMSDSTDIDELIQYAEALCETVLGETAVQLRIAVGATVRTLSGLRDSYTEAMKAMELGSMFSPDSRVLVYERMLRERILGAVPREQAAALAGLVFGKKTARIFNEEMLDTIDIFFRKDLNLSDTARQLYIHRNTIVYRLDKIQRATGLDLRSFNDAVTFRIIMDLKNCASAKNERKEP